MAATTFTVQTTRNDNEFTDRRDLRAGDKVEVLVNGARVMQVDVAAGFELDAVITVGGESREA